MIGEIILKDVKILQNKFYRIFICVVLLILIPAILVGGIIVSDANTRALGFRDHSPIFYFVEIDDGIKFNMFGDYTHFTENDVENLRENAQTAEIIIPPFIRLIWRAMRGARDLGENFALRQ